MKATDQIKHAAFEKTLDYLLEDPERNATKIMDMLDKVAPADLFPSQRTAFRNAIDQQSNWYQLITRLLELNPVMRNDFIKTFLVDGNLMAWPKQETMREKHRCNVPWAILMDPTSACNLHCTGCWAADLLRVKNFIPAISVEGFEEATDGRRGEGTYQKVVRAMRLLKQHGLPFGVSCCYTSANADSIASEEFFDWMIGQGVLFAWIFTYMPVGVDAPVELMVQADQRERLYRFVREMRSKKPLFTLDFQNDGEFVGGCIAGGRRYLHINAAGDVEPCVFAHYANANIRETTLLDALKSPIFMQYYERQPFNDNLLRPCPILENRDVLADMVETAGAHSTDLQAKESARDLCAKCTRSIEEWEPVAERIWTDPADPLFDKRHDPGQGMAETDKNKFDRLNRQRKPLEDKAQTGEPAA